jgi:hypothetical protein
VRNGTCAVLRKPAALLLAFFMLVTNIGQAFGRGHERVSAGVPATVQTYTHANAHAYASGDWLETPTPRESWTIERYYFPETPMERGVSGGWRGNAQSKGVSSHEGLFRAGKSSSLFAQVASLQPAAVRPLPVQQNIPPAARPTLPVAGLGTHSAKHGLTACEVKPRAQSSALQNTPLPSGMSAMQTSFRPFLSDAGLRLKS